YSVERIGRYSLLGSTRDDAAGEAFDKIAKLLGLGYPGGPAVERAAQDGDPAAVRFPRAMMGAGDRDFSFSGLKTAVRLYVEERKPLDARGAADVAASAQEAIVDALVRKTLSCALAAGVRRVYCAGGVAANRSLRAGLNASCEENGIRFHAPPVAYCTDNGAMVACAASKHIAHGRNDGLALDVFARGVLQSWSS
ncbi:MAG: tRNA (adenosine(37)-N6)-threonylcarbamoyltransferase complex transferase subunit TsaD, partial [Chitinivibrionia bacterium]|nr:tRNA (adenosine(37)-N6)-threonylcarbamoyltransferase complex transferase subunit TsaD [Chitinivibrionia bacterium]